MAGCPSVIPVSQRSDRLNVRLYTRKGCHLCDEAQGWLIDLARRYPHKLETVDVDTSPSLAAGFGDRVPVVQVAGRELSAPLRREHLERAFREARGA